MKQEDVVEKIMIDLLDNKMCARAYHRELRGYLAQAYAAGYNEGKLQYTKRRPVCQFTIWGGFVREYDSASIAARAVGVTKHSISKAALGKIETAAGFKWRYKDELPDSRESDGDLP
jgi:hypothetical protein